MLQSPSRGRPSVLDYFRVSGAGMRVRLLVFVLALVVPEIARADYSSAASWFNRLAERDRLEIQLKLVFTGHYIAMVDAEFGPRTFEALSNFQRDNRFSGTGVLSQRQLQMLYSQADTVQRSLGFEIVTDQRTGAQLGLPRAALDSFAPTDQGSRWYAFDGSAEVQTFLISGGWTEFTDLYGLLSSNGDFVVQYRTLSDDFFIVSGEQRGHPFYIRFQRAPASLIGFKLSWSANVYGSYFNRVAVLMSNSLFDDTVKAAVAPLTPPPRSAPTPPPAPPEPPAVAANPPAASEQTPRSAGPPETARGDSSGSGFFVTDAGHVVTNAHVVEACSTIEVAGYGPALLVRSDETNDLAVLQVQTNAATKPVSLRLDPARLGEEVLAVGFPLSVIFADSLTVTEGNVSSLSGILGDTRFLQISTPVQPGNSGGPLFDSTGHVVGVVTSQLNELALLGAAGALPQNVNFAIKNLLVVNLLQVAGIDPKPAELPAAIETMADVAQIGREVTVQVLCRG